MMDLSEFGDAAAFLRRNKDDPLLQSPAFDGKLETAGLSSYHFKWHNYLPDCNDPLVLETNLFEWCAIFESLNN